MLAFEDWLPLLGELCMDDVVAGLDMGGVAMGKKADRPGSIKDATPTRPVPDSSPPELLMMLATSIAFLRS